ncbi:hypothetical protein [Nostoc flagelliforme]|uniref:hypothetical protein n=1 Tax=Nostoc flagelliforme TaxID=1306274 RepID=UPI001682690F|nr:hypothetical protein [Nostoc flagelliforme]
MKNQLRFEPQPKQRIQTEKAARSETISKNNCNDNGARANPQIREIVPLNIAVMRLISS